MFEPYVPSNIDAVNELRWKQFPVLDEGFVCLVDVMGDDSSITNAARNCYGKGTVKVSDDRTLLRHMMRENHTSSFEFVEIVFLVQSPMDTWRQWIRHRTANVNEYSTRYSEAIDSKQKTRPDKWRLQSKDNKQGSSGFLPAYPDESTPIESCGSYLSTREQDFHERAKELYETRLRAGVAREQARKDLPLSTYTRAYWKTDLHNMLHFLSLRAKSSAQEEIREYATTIGEQIISKLFPVTWEAFVDYRRDAIRLSTLEIRAVSRLGALGWNEGAVEEAVSHIENRTERRSAAAKLMQLLRYGS